MRLLQVLVSDDQREAAAELLDEEGFDFVVYQVRSEGEKRWIVEFPIPTDAIGYVLDRLDDVGVDTDRYVVITSLESAINPQVEPLQERFSGDFDPLTSHELRSKVRDLSNDMRSFVVLILLSAIIATAGLLADSPAVIVGAMVIAPIVGPVLTASVGAVTGDREMLLASLWLQAVGLAVAVVGSIAFSYGLQYSGFVPAGMDVTSIELISLRVSPSLLTIFVGLASGAAAAWGLTTKGPTSLIGVMIAAALIPSAATAGIAVVWNEPRVAVGSLLLLFLTMILINVAAVLVLWYFEYRPESERWYFETDDRRKRAVVLGTVIALVLFVGLVGAASYQQIASERTINGEVAATLDDPAYELIDPVSIRVEYGGVDPFGSPETVTVVASRTDDGSEPPPVAGELERRIANATGDDVVVRVRFVSYQRSDEAESLRSGSGPIASSIVTRSGFHSASA